MDESVRLARIEQKLDSHIDLLERFCESQSRHNDRFYLIRDDVLEIKANARGAWFTVGIFGSLTVAVSGLVAWMVANIFGK